MNKNEKYIQTTITGIKRVSEYGYILRIRYSYEWTPGQVVGLRLLEKEPPRLYSIAGSDKEDEITILFTEKRDGLLTPRLSEVKGGDSIFASQPFGKFRPEMENAWWICNGTGIAPFRGIWQEESKNQITLIHGIRKSEEKYFENEISTNERIAYYPCLSQEDNTQNFYGRVTNYLEALDHIPSNVKYYLCGSAEMSVEVRDILIKKGVPYMNIYTEIYF